MQSVQDWLGNQIAGSTAIAALLDILSRNWNPFYALVVAFLVVKVPVFSQHSNQMPLIEKKQVIQAFSP